MVDKDHVRFGRAGGVRFTVDTKDAVDKSEESSTKTIELPWEQYCAKESSFDLYFGILKLSHSYTMTMDVVFHQAPIKLEAVLDREDIRGLELLVNECEGNHAKDRTSFQVQVVIHAETTPGHFHRRFLLKEALSSTERFATINVSGKILRQGQGTATLRNGVRMKSIKNEGHEDDE